MNNLRMTAVILSRTRTIAGAGSNRYLNLLGILLLVSVLIGCTTLRPIDVDAVTLHQKIRSGEAVETGDTIRAITIDGVAHLLYVTKVNNNVIVGHPPGVRTDIEDTVLPIENIVLIEVNRLSSDNAKTFAGGAGTGAVIVGLLLLIGIISF